MQKPPPLARSDCAAVLPPRQSGSRAGIGGGGTRRAKNPGTGEPGVQQPGPTFWELWGGVGSRVSRLSLEGSGPALPRLLRLLLNCSGKARREALGLIGWCSLLASLPLPPVLSLPRGEQSPLALALPPRRLPRNSGLLELIVDPGGLDFTQEIFKP